MSQEFQVCQEFRVNQDSQPDWQGCTHLILGNLQALDPRDSWGMQVRRYLETLESQDKVVYLECQMNLDIQGVLEIQECQAVQVFLQSLVYQDILKKLGSLDSLDRTLVARSQLLLACLGRKKNSDRGN